MNTIQAQEGMWLFNGESFVKKVSGFGSLSKWKEVAEEFKVQWEEEHQTEDGLTPDVGGGNLSNEPELLCDLTTTEYAAEAVWTQGDNGQVFDDYKEIYIKMMLQPTENNIRDFRISIEKNINVWSGKYGMNGPGDKLTFPSSTGYTKIYFTHLKKGLFGIEEVTMGSYNNSTLQNLLIRSQTSTYLNGLTYKAINNPDQLPDISFPKHFEVISIGSYVANMPPNCRFMIYGIK